MSATLITGIDVLLSTKRFSHQRIALVTNNAALTATGEQSRMSLLKNKFHLTTLFSPEHGISVQGADGAAQQNSIDAATGLPIISLYGHKLSPSEEDLKDADLVLFDIPDVGCRFYTYLWTMTYVMEACAQYNKPFIVLDRPNPMGALIEQAEGPFLEEQNCSSFTGRWNIPLKHSCTLGELALYFAATRLPQLTIEVIPVQNYQRHYTALKEFSFVPTSPALQTIRAAMFYPGTGLLEGVNLNEGRGTGYSFTVLSAPWIHATQLCDALNALQLTGVAFKPVHYRAVTPPYINENCNGVQLHITDHSKLQAVHTGVTVLQTIAALYPQQLEQRLYPTHANPSGSQHLDKLLGFPNAFEAIVTGQKINLQVAEEWYRQIQAYLLYY
ncbi:DUF1343 domain-containing protein [Lacibacter sp. MH-610]|uniref:exo-beta-N-acetylmuramidase NamZ family protein n=1 Tax=Lacibacter sp. MH-610 TaxID=3020883 RepID=UPI00389188E9